MPEKRGEKSAMMMRSSKKRKDSSVLYQFTHLLAQLLLANASGLALKAKPIPSI
jgi:hypothetical protein